MATLSVLLNLVAFFFFYLFFFFFIFFFLSSSFNSPGLLITAHVHPLGSVCLSLFYLSISLLFYLSLCFHQFYYPWVCTIIYQWLISGAPYKIFLCPIETFHLFKNHWIQRNKTNNHRRLFSCVLRDCLGHYVGRSVGTKSLHFLGVFLRFRTFWT